MTSDKEQIPELRLGQSDSGSRFNQRRAGKSRKKGFNRNIQLAAIIFEELELILSAANDERLSQLRVVDIQRKSGSNYMVMIAPREEAQLCPTKAELVSLLSRAEGYVRSELAAALNLKRCPLVTLVPDPVIFF